MNRFKVPSFVSYFASGHQTRKSSRKFQLLAQGIFVFILVQSCLVV